MRIVLLACAIIAMALTLSACADEATPTAPEEFIAQESDFVGYAAWEQTTAPRTGVDPSGALGGAHAEMDTNMIRSMFVSPNGAQRTDGGQYPVGTIFAKEMKTTGDTVVMITAMAKRGNNFDASGNDWEYLVLDGTGAITGRGADLMNGMCRACHTGAQALDYVFTR